MKRETCSGSGTDGTPLGIQYMCNVCGDLFMSYVVPEHRPGVMRDRPYRYRQSARRL